MLEDEAELRVRRNLIRPNWAADECGSRKKLSPRMLFRPGLHLALLAEAAARAKGESKGEGAQVLEGRGAAYAVGLGTRSRRAGGCG
jgi:hypothetical protein